MIFIDTITACNRRCSYCPNSMHDRGSIKNMKKMPAKLFYKIKNILIKTFENIDDIISLGIDILDKSFKQIYFLTHCPKFNYRLSKITHIIDSLLIKNSIYCS